MPRCPSCRKATKIDKAKPGEDKCESCHAALTKYALHGTFKLDRITVYIVPGRTRLVENGKKGRLKTVEDLEPGQHVRVFGDIIDPATMVGTRVEYRKENPATDPGEPDLARLERRERWVGMGFFSIVGCLIALLVGSVEGLLSFNLRRAALCGGLGCAIGFAGGLAGIIPAGMIYAVSNLLTLGLLGDIDIDSFQDVHGLPLFTQIVGRSLAWGAVGMTLALGQGVAVKSKRLIFNGLIGGCLGGLFGGMFFDPIVKLIPSDGAEISRAIGCTMVGLMIGLCIGLVEQLSKESWLLLRSGPLHGKQFVIFKKSITVGSHSSCDIFLFRDPLVRTNHAKLNRVGRASSSRTWAPAESRRSTERRITRRVLRDGDLITIRQDRARIPGEGLLIWLNSGLIERSAGSGSARSARASSTMKNRRIPAISAQRFITANAGRITTVAGPTAAGERRNLTRSKSPASFT